MFSLKSVLFLLALSFGLQNYAMEDKNAYDPAVIAEIERKTEIANIDRQTAITPLMYCVIMPEYRSYCKFFLDNRVHDQESSISTALMFAISFNLEDLVAMFVNHIGATLKQTRVGNVILEFAVNCNNPQIIEMVRSGLSDENLELDNTDLITADNPVEMNVPVNTFARMDDEPATTDDDLDQSREIGDVNALSTRNHPSEQISATDQMLEIKEFLQLETNEINKVPGFGLSALMTAILLPRFHPYVQLFLDEDINTKSEDGSTALMLAVTINAKEIVRLLLVNGADIDLENNDGKTALNIARDYNFVEIAEMLRAEKASLDNNEQAVAENSAMDIDQLEQEHDECEYDSDKDFRVSPDFYEQERDQSEIDYSSDEDFTVNVASFEEDYLEESRKPVNSREIQEKNLNNDRINRPTMSIERSTDDYGQIRAYKWHTSCICNFPACSYIAIDAEALSKHKQNHTNLGSHQ